MIRSHSVPALVLAACFAATATAQTRLVWLQPPETYTTIESSTWRSPSAYDVEAADDFEFTGDVRRVIARGDYGFQSPAPSGFDGVWVRFYAWVNEAPGALQHEVFVPEGSPGFVHQNRPTDLDVTLPLPFRANGRHFVSVQLATPSAQAWGWWGSSHGSSATTRLGSSHQRQGRTGTWQVHRTILGYEIDLAFEIWGEDPSGPRDPQDPCGPWEELETPPLPPNYGTSILRDLVVVDFDDVWAVGDPSVEVRYLQFEARNLALHWNGIEWREVPTPNPSVFPAPDGSTGLQGIDALARDFVWAIGNQEKRDPLGFIIDQPLLLHWNGSAWSEVPVPNTNYDTSSNGVKLLAPNDAWIVGGGVGTACGGGLAIHWDGTSFTETTTPGASCGLAGGRPGFDLEAIDGVAGNDVWAVGGGSDGDFSGTTYVLHWNGSSWRHVPAPSPGLARRLFDLHARATDDVWAVGQYEALVGGQLVIHAFAIHWDGSSWTLHDGATQPIGSLAVHAFGPSVVYTAGGTICRWDGRAWQVADDLDQLTGANLSVAVAALDAAAPCHLWAAGRQDGAGQLVPFTARHVGSRYWRTAVRRCGPYPGPEGGLSVVDPPKLGATFSVAIDDPRQQTGFRPGATQTLWLLSTAPAPGGGCGLLVPGIGLGGGPGAVLIDVGPTAVVVSLPARPWSGPGVPAIHGLPLPNVASLLGLTLATQGLLFDTTAASPVVLTDALDATLGS